MDIEDHASCAYDSVEVRKSDVNSLGESFCGSTLPPVQVSTGNQMLVAFRSDYSVTGRGFRASYVINGGSTDGPTTPTTTTAAPTTQVPECSQTLTDLEGEITSPNYPNDYDNHRDCTYLIEVSIVHTYIVEFSHL